MTDLSEIARIRAILRWNWNTFLSLYSSRRLQIINARYKDIEGFKFGYTRDMKGFSYKHPKVNDFCELNNTYEQPSGKFNVGFINHLVDS